MPREWDAATYDRVADPMARWGSAVLDRLPLAGDERVLDAGCGTGRVTELLLGRLPRGGVVALDHSEAMLAEARRRLAAHRGRVAYVCADLADPIPVERVDAVLSTATFHWVRDQDRLFANLAAVLRPGGRLVAQCGGVGNIASVRAALARLGVARDGTYFATTAETDARLAAAGFVDVNTWIQAEPTPFDSTEALATYLAAIVIREPLAALPEAERPAFVRAVIERLPRLEIDYVRLNIDARRPPASA
jgi:trans-aconitate 2-methyltransferase